MGNATCGGPSPETLLKARKRLAESLLYMEEFPRSYRLWKEIAAEYPEDGEAGTYILLLESIKGKDSAALEKKALAGKTAFLFRVAGLARMWLGDTASATRYLARAGTMDPADYISHFYLGKIYEEKENFDEGIKAYKKSVGANPVFAPALNNMGYCFKEKGFYIFAVQYYAKAIAISPENSGYHYNLGNAYTLRGMFKEAFDEYKLALALDPGFAKAHFNMGNTYLRFGKLEEALEEYKLYLKYWSPELNPEDAPPPEYVKDQMASIEFMLKKERP
jgi:tetratricopeptide (TPR) repeat protein